MALNNYSVRNAVQVFQQHGFSLSHHLHVLDIAGVPDYVKKELIDLEGRVYIKTASVPKVGVAKIDYKYQAFPLTMPGQIEFENEQTWSIRMPSDFLLRNALERWIFDLANPDSSCGIGKVPCQSTYVDYMLVGQNCDVSRGYRLIGMFPVSVGAVQYNQEDTAMVDFDFVFHIQRWEPISINESLVSIQDNRLDAIYSSFDAQIASGLQSCVGKNITV